MFPAILKQRIFAFAHDLLTIPVAWFGAYFLRFNFEAIPERFLQQAVYMLPLLLLVQAIVFKFFGLYRGVWRFASLPDLTRIIKSVVIGVSLSAVIIFFVTRLEDIPRAIFPLYGILLIVLLGGPRLLYRRFKDKTFYNIRGRNVLIIGAGSAGEMLVRELLREKRRYSLTANVKQTVYLPAVLVDDDTAKIGSEIHGLPIVGPCEKIPEITDKYNIEKILIALPDADSTKMRRIVELCEKTNLPFQTLPRMQELMDGTVTVDALREVSIEDLLGRESVSLDWNSINKYIKDRIIIVTGGGGSIGSELCRQIASIVPKELVVIEKNEFNLYKIHKEISKKFPNLNFYAYLGDVCVYESLSSVFEQHHPDVIFHAAAYKHVPILEYQIREAVHNNIIGTRTLVKAADTYNCNKFVLISTDKAVNPSSIMGTSKRVAEIYCQAFNEQSSVEFVTVRFGNVLESDGSVVPLFKEQLKQGGPLTVTDKNVARFFMTIPEACQLIMQSASMGNGGEVFVLDMGEPVKIVYLAEQLIRLSGKKPYEDIDIKYIGMRPGEKMDEELFYPNETLVKTEHEKVFLVEHESHDFQRLNGILDEMSKNCRNNALRLLSQNLTELVPEFTGKGDS